MNEHKAMLQMLIEKDTLTSSELKDGIVACFFATNRDFVKRRLGDVPDEDVDEALSRLITRVFNEYHIDPEKPNIQLLQQVEQVLEDRIGFGREPDLVEKHKEVIQVLFSRSGK